MDRQGQGDAWSVPNPPFPYNWRGSSLTFECGGFRDFSFGEVRLPDRQLRRAVMNRKAIIVVAGLVVIAAAAVVLVARRGEATPEYRMVEITFGDIESTVSATGSLSAVSTVQVGTQVSGQVAQIGVDFNDRVRKGQVIARIDPTLAQQAVREAQASLDRARADADMKKYTYDQAKQLFDQAIITESEFRAASYDYAVSRASLQSAQAALDRSQRNLEYTVIRAPIDGIVVERNVDVGQTVAASLSAPQLFLIAENLANMQILASIDESDIGRISTGQRVRFTVQAYPERRFEGSVKQVRLQSVSTENVVNYTVVIGVANAEGLLLPGMTATVDVLVESANAVLKVPNAALRFRATEAMRQTAGVQAGTRADSAQLWYFDEQGKLAVTQVRTGLSDGQNTEISGPVVCEGMKVIAGLVQSTTPATAVNPFQPTRQGGPPRGGGP
jgi:HlyD family secretion protein